MKHIQRFYENTNDEQTIEPKKNETYLCSMPLNNEGTFRVYVKVKFLGKSNDGHFVVAPLETLRFQSEGRTNGFEKDKHYNCIGVKNFLNLDFSPLK